MIKYRLFLALPLPNKLISFIQKLEAEIDKKIGFRVPWILPRNLHLTIIFLGWQNQETLYKIDQMLTDYPFGINELNKPFDCLIKKLDYGPPGSQRMIWLYLDNDERLEKLHKTLKTNLNLNEIKIKEEDRQFLPHINLARLKKINKYLPEIKKNLDLKIVFNKLVLFESKLYSTGAQYYPLKEVILK